MEGLEDFTKYDQPKEGLFQITTDKYILGKGWGVKIEKRTIIGETDHFFVERLHESGHGEWLGNEVIERKYIIPIGIHKSRLINWITN